MRRVVIAALVVAAALLAWCSTGQDAAAPGLATADPEASRAPHAAEIVTGGTSAEPSAPPTRERLESGEPSPSRGNGALCVRVLLALEDRPLAHVAVRVTARDGRDGDSTPRVAVTDLDGRAVFQSLDTGLHHVELDRRLAAQVQVTDGRIAELTLTVPAGVDALARVLDAGGGPVPGAEVWLWGASGVLDTPALEPGEVVGHTDAGGELTVRGLPHRYGHGTWLAARHPLLGVSAARMVRAPLTPDDSVLRVVELRLGLSGAFLELRVTGADGQPLAGALAQARPVDRPGSTADGSGRVLAHVLRQGRTDSHGLVTLWPLAPCDYQLRVLAAGHETLREALRVDAPQRLLRDVRLAREARLHGRVTSRDGEAIANAEVRAQVDPSGGKALSSASGHFAITGLAPGTAAWIVSHERFESIEGQVALARGEDPELRITLDPLAMLRGRVLDEAGHGIAGIGLTATADLPGYADDAHHGVSDAQGAFELLVRRDLEYRLLVCEPGHVMPLPIPGLDAVRVRDEPWIIRVPDDARTSAYVEGLLVDGDGRPAIEGKQLSVAGERFQAYPGNTMRAADIDAATGGFRVGPLPPGKYTLRFASRTTGELAVPDLVLRPRATTQLGRIVVPAAGILRAELTLADGLHPSDVKVELTGERATDHFEVDVATGIGQKPVLPGRYQVTVFGTGFRALRSVVEAVAGETCVVRGTLRAAVRVGLRLHMPPHELGAAFTVRAASGEVAFDAELEAGVASEDWWPFLDRGSFVVEAIGVSGRRYETRFVVDSLERRTVPIDVRVEMVH